MGYEIRLEQRCAFGIGETFGRGFRRGREISADRSHRETRSDWTASRTELAEVAYLTTVPMDSPRILDYDLTSAIAIESWLLCS